MAQRMPADSMIPHGDIKRINHAVRVAHRAVSAKEGVVIAAFEINQAGIELAKHRETLESFGIAELGLKGHPLAAAEEAAKRLLDGRFERRPVAALDRHHLVQAAGQAALVGVGVALEGHREGGVR